MVECSFQNIYMVGIGALADRGGWYMDIKGMEGARIDVQFRGYTGRTEKIPGFPLDIK